MLQSKIRSFQPKSSKPYKQFIINKKSNEKKDSKSLYLKLGVLSNFRGSAYMEFGQTKIICVVFPPQEPSKNNVKNVDMKAVQCTVSLAPFSNNDNSQNTIKKQKGYAIALKKALEPFIFRQEFLSFKVGIYVLVLEDSGYVLSTALNCCGAALAEGGIPIFDICAASTSFRNIEYKYEDEDDENEAKKIKNLENINNNLTAYSNQNQVSECFQKGYISFDTFKSELLSTVKKNESILNHIQNILLNGIKKR